MQIPKITLEAARVNAHLTQREAAKKLDISIATLQNYESGKTTPNWNMIQISDRSYFFAIVTSF